jgi:CheY-like chemotaxis protein
LAEAKKINFSITGCDSDQSYDLDPVRLKQIFFNILSNSLKFTPDNGHISLVCNVSPKDKDCDNLIFKASDDGAGMSKEFQNHMYEAFSQENRTITANNSGTGLGLAIVFNLVKLMHGNIDLRSDIGEGTVFYITLPAKKTNEAAPIVAEQTTSLDVLKGRRALLFEDNDINAKIATTLLQDKGLSVDRAENGKIGVGMFIDQREFTYDVILMDMRMPVMDGVDATKAIRALSRNDAHLIPIIAMTANAYNSDVQVCLAAGMNAHLSKPIDPKIMYTTIADQISEYLRKKPIKK